ncbi:MAG: hypothetical protein Q9162_005357 [Coniocarpon cinnabarinum]
MIDVTEKGVFLSRHSDILPESVENFKYNWKDIPRLSHQATLTPIERDSASSTDMRLPRKGDRWTNCELLQKRKIIGIKLVMAYVALVKIIIQEFGQKTPSPPADAAGEDAGEGSSTNPFAGRAGAGPYLGLGKRCVERSGQSRGPDQAYPKGESALLGRWQNTLYGSWAPEESGKEGTGVTYTQVSAHLILFVGHALPPTQLPTYLPNSVPTTPRLR